MKSLIKEFSLERIQKGGAIFDIKRLDFLNGFYIRQRSVEKLTEFCLPFLIESGLITPSFETKQYPPAYGAKEIVQTYKISETGEEINIESLQKIVSLYKDRLKKLSEITELTDFFLKDVLEYDKELLRWKDMPAGEVKENLNEIDKILCELKEGEWRKENLEKVLMPRAEKMGPDGAKNRGYLLWPFRVALTGKKASAGPFEIAELLGKEKTLARIRQARAILK
jgi:glutamyl/glutaminyl-tRNA synthetase